MPLLPTLRINYAFLITVLYSTLAGQDYVQRRSKSPNGPLHSIVIKGIDVLASEEAVIYEFYCDRRGGWEAFAMFDPSDSKIWKDIHLGTGDGVVTDYPIGCKNTSEISVTVAGADNTDWMLSAGTGPDGQDVLVFAPAPNGDVVVKFTGNRYFANCVFVQKGLDRQRLSFALRSCGLEINEVSQ